MPVRIKNLVDASKNTPNTSSDSASWVFTRRFFIVDRVSGVASASSCNEILRTQTSVIRFLKHATLDIQSQGTTANKIYKPLLTLEYKDQVLAGLTADVTADVTYKTTYHMSLSGFWTGAIIGFVIVNLLVIAMVWFMVDSWSAYHWYDPNIPADVEAYKKKRTKHILISGFEVWSLFVWIYVNILALYWFLVYKWMDDVSAVIPTASAYPSDYIGFYIMLALMFVGWFVWLMMEISRQSDLDLYFIDWEKPRFYLKRQDGIK